MLKIVTMIIYFGVGGKGSNFDTIIYPNLEACEAMKIAIVEVYKDAWYGPDGDDIKCVIAEYKE